MTRGESEPLFLVSRLERGRGGGRGRVCVHWRDRIRDEEATKGVFAPLSKRRFLRRSVIQRDASEEGGKKVMACNVTLCDCGLVLLRAGRVGGGEIRATGANCSLSRSVPRVKLTRDKSERCRRIGKWPRS